MATSGWKRAHGLFAATLTPMHQDGSINYDMIAPYIDHLHNNGITQIYLNGTAAEHALLTVAERKQLAEKWMSHGRSKLQCIVVHCGAGNLAESRELAAHAESIGADCVACVMPTYFKPSNVGSIAEYCAQVAKAAPNTPFMYYHFPGATGINFRATDIIRACAPLIPNLIGAKFTAADLFDAGEALQLDNGKYDIILGAEHMFISGLAMGIDSGIGIAFSLIAKPCARIRDAFHRGDIKAAQLEQYKVQKFWSTTHTPGQNNELVASFKACMSFVGLDFGPPRLPIQPLSKDQVACLKKTLETNCAFSTWIK